MQRIGGSSFMCCGSFYGVYEVAMPLGLLSFKIIGVQHAACVGNLRINPFAKHVSDKWITPPEVQESPPFEHQMRI